LHLPTTFQSLINIFLKIVGEVGGERGKHFLAMHPDAPYFSILLCLMPDDFTRQVVSAATQWVNVS
jgi:hypothetical protein